MTEELSRTEQLSRMNKKRLRREINRLEQQVAILVAQAADQAVVERRLREQKIALGDRNIALRAAVLSAHSALSRVLGVRNGGDLNGSIPFANRRSRGRLRHTPAPSTAAPPQAGPV